MAQLGARPKITWSNHGDRLTRASRDIDVFGITRTTPWLDTARLTGDTPDKWIG